MRTQQSNILYKAALYLRLSKDDENVNESSSISTQRSILREYAKTKGILVIDEYIDDGYSGTNYDRPDFNRMLRDIEKGLINCVITKDLSRLGRNSSKTADLLDEYFPSHHVRYIAVIEGYDTLRLTNGSVMAAPFMLLMNEMYARDISNKIRSSFQIKMEKGEYIGSFAPYGYKKDTEHGKKNHLIVDHQVSFFVQEMFQMAADGCSPGKIAEHFNEKGIATPAVYRCSTRPYLNISNYSKRKEWTSSIVCKMLKNRVYLGHTIQGKTTKVSFKSKEVLFRKDDEWIEVRNTHEPLISEALYDAVRRRSVSRRSLPNKGFVNIFSGIAKCADCHRNMTTAPSRKKGCIYNLACGGYKSYGAKECSNHFIDYEVLYNTILRELRFLLSLSDEQRKQIVKDLERDCLQKQNTDQDVMQSLNQWEQRMQEVSMLMKKLYEEYAFGRITEKTYKTLSAEYEAECKSLEKSICQIKHQAEYSCEEMDKGHLYLEFFALLDEVAEIQALTPQLLKKLIDRIEVGQGVYETDECGKQVKHQTVKIYYRFIGNTDMTP